jgi:excisionase family DNA binding protein
MASHDETNEHPERLGYSIKEAAQATGLSTRTVYRLLEAGTLESVRIGGRVIIKAASLRKLLEADK